MPSSLWHFISTGAGQICLMVLPPPNPPSSEGSSSYRPGTRPPPYSTGPAFAGSWGDPPPVCSTTGPPMTSLPRRRCRFRPPRPLFVYPRGPRLTACDRPGYMSPPTSAAWSWPRGLPTIDATRRQGSGMAQDTRRYDRLAEQYSRYRPRYPGRLISHLAAIIAEAPASDLVVDVGAGTGIFTRQLRAVLPDEIRIIGIEPSPSMRA